MMKNSIDSSIVICPHCEGKGEMECFHEVMDDKEICKTCNGVRVVKQIIKTEYEDIELTPQEINELNKLEKERDYWELESKKYCAELGEIKIRFADMIYKMDYNELPSTLLT